MSESPLPAGGEPTRRSLTTRRSFIAGLSLGGVSLYGLWAAYGAVPLAFWNPPGSNTSEASGGEDVAAAPTAEHGGHAAMTSGPSPEEFRRLTNEFIAQYSLPDGSVSPDASAVVEPEMGAGHDMGHDVTAVAPPDAQSNHDGQASEPHDMTDMGGGMPPATVYLAVQQWLFEPGVLRLKVDAPYRFRMMALDVSHGASLQLGRGSRVIRLRPGVLDEREITFSAPGEYLVYCTVYCGAGHDQMYSKIIVG